MNRTTSDPVRASWQALWASRVLVWAGGVGAVLIVGLGRSRGAFDARGLTGGFGHLANLLVAPAARWDSSWYLVIAHYGYRPDLSPYTSSRSAFFPLYPLGIGVLSRVGFPPILAGVLISVGAMWLSLYGIHRLTTLELERESPSDGRVAGLAVRLTAFGPMAFFFSAVYSESLYLALSVGLFWFARKGRWAIVGLLGALAATTRSAGVVLMLPALLIYLYGPREDRAAIARLARSARPRHRPERDILWLALIPAGLALYMGYLALEGGDALMPFHAEQVWSRQFAGPFLATWDGAKAAFDGARQLLSFQSRHLYYPLAGSSPAIESGHNVMLFAFLLAATPLIFGVFRRLPIAYGAYVMAALALPLSYPVSTQPLMSIPRFLLVLFPLNMWLALVLADRRQLQLATLWVSAGLLVFFSAEFATWHWVA